jgi:UDP-N-acetyl-D-galactosamine dehydrogenase
VILSGRRINDGMGAYVAQRVVKLLAQSGLPVREARVGILGLTFKENVPDTRNSKVADLYRELRDFGLEPIVNDPLADAASASAHYGIDLAKFEEFRDLHVLILAVAHEEYQSLSAGQLGGMLADRGIVVDLRSMIDPATLRSDLTYWSL